ncbi:hypothetical protein [Shewanella glacialipiscicola]|uniref:hypothetical protein n=1 Tax=Shewanella glacialipiscicola TaxID=614069 RepID=UPI003D7AF35F
MEFWGNTFVAVIGAVVGAFLAGLVGFVSTRYIRTDEIKSHKNALYIEIEDIAKNSQIVMETLYDAYCLIYCATQFGRSDYKQCIQLPSPVHGFYLRDMSIACFAQLTFEQRKGLKALSFNLDEQENMINDIRSYRPFSSIDLGHIISAIRTLGVIYHNATLLAQHKERYKMDNYSPEQMAQRIKLSHYIEFSDSPTILAKGQEVYEREMEQLDGL